MRILSEIVEFPISAAPRSVDPDELPVALPHVGPAEELQAHRLVLWVYPVRPTAQVGPERGSFQLVNFTVGVLSGCRVDAGDLQESGSEIQHTGELSIRLATPGELGMKDDRGRPCATLTWKTLVEPEGCRAHLPPARTIADIRSGPPQ